MPNSLGLENKMKNRFADDSFENRNLRNICYNILKISNIFSTIYKSIKLLDGSVGWTFLIYEFEISSIDSEYCAPEQHFSIFFKRNNKEISFWYLLLIIKSYISALARQFTAMFWNIFIPWKLSLSSATTCNNHKP